MQTLSVNFETSDFLVVKEGERIRFRCPIRLTDLGCHESVDRFIARKGGVDATVAYLRQMKAEDTERSMGLRIAR